MGLLRTPSWPEFLSAQGLLGLPPAVAVVGAVSPQDALLSLCPKLSQWGPDLRL